MPKPPIHSAKSLSLAEHHLRPGQRIAIAVSGGADSVALLRATLERADALGLVLSIVHVHHGIRGEEADRDQAFVEALASSHGLQLHLRQVDTPAHAAAHGESLEEAARKLRYAFFHELLIAGHVDAVATAHTLDDQAETVLHKLLRGAWTEGLGGISPMVSTGKGVILRPLLAVTRAEVEAYLKALGQSWCEDATNQDLVYTRNRLRHHLLPILKDYNPQLATQFSRLATIARDEEAWWQREVARVGRGLLLPGKPVRGGGRASSTHPEEASTAFELERLRALDPAMRRRILRWAVAHLQPDLALDFEQTERLMDMCGSSSVLKRLELSPALSVQRTVRELQFLRSARVIAAAPQHLALSIPGKIEQAGWIFTATPVPEASAPIPAAVIRTPQPGDRVTLRYTSGPKKVKEIFERLKVSAAERGTRLVVAWESRIVWMEGIEVDPASLADLPFRLQVERTGA